MTSRARTNHEMCARARTRDRHRAGFTHDRPWAELDGPWHPVDALAHFSESLTLSREIEEPRTIAYCLEGAARIFLERGHETHAAGLLGAASEIRRRTGSVSSPGRRATTAAFEARCRAALSTDTFARAWDEGAALDASSAADWALRLGDDTQVS